VAHDGKLGVSDVLEFLKPHYSAKEHREEGVLLGLEAHDGSVTLEPAAQLEISIAPYRSIRSAQQAYERFHAIVDPFLASRGAQILHCGYHPTRAALDLELIPKRRYDYMNDYFRFIGSHGEQMMRASASMQVSVDYVSEDDAVRKMRIAQAMAPILAAICDYTTMFEGEPNSTPIRRFELWREVDGLRCGVVPGIFKEGFGFEAYTDWLLRTPPIFVTRPATDNPEGPTLRAAYETPAQEVYADAPMSQADVEHLLSMFWPDVRLKRFVEIRPADSNPESQASGYTALVKGLFYSEASLAAVEQELGAPQGGQGRPAWPLTEEDVENAGLAIRSQGFEGLVYGKVLREWEELLFALADSALPEDERPFLGPLREFAANKPWWHTEA
jgi:glutamate--cysteine ligase